MRAAPKPARGGAHRNPPRAFQRNADGLSSPPQIIGKYSDFAARSKGAPGGFAATRHCARPKPKIEASLATRRRTLATSRCRKQHGLLRARPRAAATAHGHARVKYGRKGPPPWATNPSAGASARPQEGTWWDWISAMPKDRAPDKKNNKSSAAYNEQCGRRRVARPSSFMAPAA